MPFNRSVFESPLFIPCEIYSSFHYTNCFIKFLFYIIGNKLEKVSQQHVARSNWKAFYECVPISYLMHFFALYFSLLVQLFDSFVHQASSKHMMMLFVSIWLLKTELQLISSWSKSEEIPSYLTSLKHYVWYFFLV